MGILVLSVLWCFAAAMPLPADDFSHETRFFQQLTAPMTSVVDGMSFRNGLTSIAMQPGLNLWLDRHVDPSMLIDAGPAGPTVFAAIEKIAASKNCSIMPVAGVVLVGREKWVLQTTASLLSIPRSKRGHAIDVSWDDLTTPDEALRSVSHQPELTSPPLPHDLWPAVNWHDIDRQVAVTLILAQFDIAGEQQQLTNDPPTSLTRRYSLGSAPAKTIRDALRSSDPSSRIQTSAGWLVATASVKGHQAATIAILGQAGEQSGPDPDTDTFSLKAMTTSAENALRQFAQAANKACIIKPEAAESCRSVVSIEGRDVTLRQLVELVAKKAGVRADWQDEAIVISLPR